MQVFIQVAGQLCLTAEYVAPRLRRGPRGWYPPVRDGQPARRAPWRRTAKRGLGRRPGPGLVTSRTTSTGSGVPPVMTWLFLIPATPRPALRPKQQPRLSSHPHSRTVSPGPTSKVALGVLGGLDFNGVSDRGSNPRRAAPPATGRCWCRGPVRYRQLNVAAGHGHSRFAAAWRPSSMPIRSADASAACTACQSSRLFTATTPTLALGRNTHSRAVTIVRIDQGSTIRTRYLPR